MKASAAAVSPGLGAIAREATAIAELNARCLRPARLILALFGRVRAWKGRADLPFVPIFAFAYSDDPASQLHAALAVLDALPATGRCPVGLA